MIRLCYMLSPDNITPPQIQMFQHSFKEMDTPCTKYKKQTINL